MKFVYTLALCVGSALAAPQGPAADAPPTAVGAPTPGAAGGISLGMLLASVDMIVEGLGEKIPDLKKSAGAVSDAIMEFAKTAKEIKPEEVVDNKPAGDKTA